MIAARLILVIILIHTTGNLFGIGTAKPPKQVVIGYVGGFRGLVNTSDIDAEKLTHINYAFVDVKDSIVWLHNLATDTINFRELNLLKQHNPDLKILISVGGWAWSENFSDAALTETSRYLFAASAVEIVRQYNLDGIDIDWEYPGMRGEDNIFRSEDKQNFTLLLKALRQGLNALQAETGRIYELTAAVGGGQFFINHTEMAQVQQYLDYVNIMSYDFFTSGPLSGHHTNLYPSYDYNQESSAHRAVKEFIAAGVPAPKLVIGIAFYGRSWQVTDNKNNGLNQQVVKVINTGGFSEIKNNLVNKQGYKRYWDRKAKAPYLFNAATHTVVSYDDEKSVKYKCRYVQKEKLGGVMFWEYFSDPQEYLLNTIHQTFK